MTATLAFHLTHGFGYPTPAFGGATAMTVARIGHDPVLAFLTQQPAGDYLYLLDMCEGRVLASYDTPVDRPQISGMGFSPVNGKLFCGSGYETDEYVTVIDPEDGSVVDDFALANPGFADAQGFGTNGLALIRARGDVLQLSTMNGFRLGERSYPGRNIRGVGASPFSWTFIDAAANEIVVVDPFGNEIATAPAPGTPASGIGVEQVITGPHAICFDTINFPYEHAQLCIPATGLPEDAVDDDGNILGPYNPQTPWDPEPWLFRHRLFIANQSGDQIYAGYLYQP